MTFPREKTGRRHAPLDEPQRALAAAWLPLAMGRARWHSRSRPRLLEEFQDAAIDGLIEAARDYHPGMRAHFSTVACAYIRNKINDRARFLARSNRRPSVPVGRLDAGGPEVAIPARLPDDDHDFESMILGLPPREAGVLRMRFAEGLTCREAGRRLGVSSARAWAIQARAIRRLVAEGVA